ncbi:outer membrane protein assembly factor BamE [Aquabacterium sp.]|uniref:outer membrane protein assembly factor BamE domain-containing protein n=1 Tax=Aquabacterium sp. TaxID=1872578 RepID=UPI00378510B9
MSLRSTLSLLIPLLLCTLLAACDQQRIEKLQPGVSGEAEVRQQFGEPVMVVEKADGSKVLEYPRQPEGSTNYFITLGPDGKLQSIRQALTPESFAQVQPGMPQGEVRKLLGRPAKAQRFAMKPDEEVWDWRFLDGQQKKQFSVTFDREHKVLSTATADDPRETMQGGR